MLKFGRILLICTLWLMACQTIAQKDAWLAPNILNSQRIELKFGSYGVDILAQNHTSRLANLYSFYEGQKSTRTLAFTRYHLPMDKALLLAHEEILKGGSIGSTLKNHGFQVKKQFFFLENISMPKISYFTNNNLPAVIYELIANIDGRDLHYCTILEVYDPNFLTIEEARNLYPITLSDPKRAKEILSSFEALIITSRL